MANSDKAAQIREIKNFDTWAEQIWYWRTHLDMFIEEYFHIKLKDTQHVEARAFGNCDTMYFVQSRGYGKSWLVSICCIAMAVLYPGSLIAVISGTAEQAVLVLRKIDDYFAHNPDVLREIDCSKHNRPVMLNTHKGICEFKNGSKIESFSLGTFRGHRCKVLVVDEAPEVKKEDLEAIARPVRNYTREWCVQAGVQDYPSKMCSITSACLKSNYFFNIFTGTLKRMAQGDDNVFAFALNYESAARVGISPMSFFEEERRVMDETKFAMEYDSIFIGAEANSVFPYELTERRRTLKTIEVAQPAKSTVEYVMSLDIATSSASNADNAVLTTAKLVELEDGNYLKQVVRIQSFHGKRLDGLATEVRKNLVRFPNTIKVIVDCRGVGDAFPQFMSKPWTDPDTGKEYPPLVCDTERSNIDNAVPLIHPFIANNLLNNQMVSCLTIALEQGTIELPINSRYIVNNRVASIDDEDDDKGEDKKLTSIERAVYVEADAMQIELGNIIGRPGANGSVLYDCAKSTQHKDRASSIMMLVHYVSGLEEERKKRLRRGNSPMVYGIVSSIK